MLLTKVIECLIKSWRLVHQCRVVKCRQLAFSWLLGWHGCSYSHLNSFLKYQNMSISHASYRRLSNPKADAGTMKHLWTWGDERRWQNERRDGGIWNVRQIHALCLSLQFVWMTSSPKADAAMLHIGFYTCVMTITFCNSWFFCSDAHFLGCDDVQCFGSYFAQDELSIEDQSICS
jgi:hypothetical protein